MSVPGYMAGGGDQQRVCSPLVSVVGDAKHGLCCSAAVYKRYFEDYTKS